MNQTTKLLILLVAITSSVNYYNYFNVDNKELSRKIAMINNRIVKEETFLSETINELPSSKPSISTEMLFSQKIRPAIALSKMQKMIEESAKEAGIELSNINWGEAFVLSETQIRVLPIQFNATGKPFRFRRFVKALQEKRKIIKPESIVVSVKKNTELLIFQVQLQMFQKANDVE